MHSFRMTLCGIGLAVLTLTLPSAAQTGLGPDVLKAQVDRQMTELTATY